MNIFYLSPDETVAAQMHCDSHCSKMIIEYAHFMSTANLVLDGEEEDKKYHLSQSSKH